MTQNENNLENKSENKDYSDILQDFSKLEEDVPLSPLESAKKELLDTEKLFKEVKLVSNSLNSEGKLDLLRRVILDFLKNTSPQDEDKATLLKEKGKVITQGLPKQDYMMYAVNSEENRILLSINSMELHLEIDIQNFIRLNDITNRIMEDLKSNIHNDLKGSFEFLLKNQESIKEHKISNLVINPSTGKELSIEKEFLKKLALHCKDIINSNLYSKEQKKELLLNIRNTFNVYLNLVNSEDNSSGDYNNMFKRLDNFIEEELDSGYIPEDNIDESKINKDILEEIKENKKQMESFKLLKNSNDTKVQDLFNTDSDKLEYFKSLGVLNSNSPEEEYENLITNGKFEDFEIKEEELDYSKITPTLNQLNISRLVNSQLEEFIKTNKNSIDSLLTNDIKVMETTIDVDYLKQIYKDYGPEAAQEEISRLSKEEQIKIVSQLTKVLNLSSDI